MNGKLYKITNLIFRVAYLPLNLQESELYEIFIMKLNLQSKSFGHICAFLAVICFALNIPASSYILNNHVLEPLPYTFVRVTGGLLFCWIGSIFAKKQPVTNKKDFLGFILWGFLGLGTFFFLFARGMEATSPIAASIIMTMTPVMVLIISAIVFKEKITSRKGIGITLALGGALLVILLMHDKSGKESSMVGNILIWGAATIYALYLVFTRNISQRYSAIILLRWFFLFAFICYFPFGIKPFIASDLVHHGTAIDIWLTVFIAIFPTAVGYLLLPIAMKRINTTVISMYNYSIPIIASGVSIALHQAKLQWNEPIAAVLVIAGVYLVNVAKKKNLEKDETMVTTDENDLKPGKY